MKLIIDIPTPLLTELTLEQLLSEETEERIQERGGRCGNLIIEMAQQRINDIMDRAANISDPTSQEAMYYLAGFAELLSNATVVGICSDTLPMDLIAEANKVILSRPLGESTLNQFRDKLFKSFQDTKEQLEQPKKQKPEFNTVMLDAMKAAGLIK